MTTPIILTLVPPDETGESELAGLLGPEGFAARPPGQPEQTRRADAGRPFAGVVVFEKFDRELVGKAVERTRAAIRDRGGDERCLVICGKDPGPDERELRRLGANKVVCPGRWEPDAVARRIVAALLGRFIVSRDGVEMELSADFDDGGKLYRECRVPYGSATRVRRMIGGTLAMRQLFAEIEICSRSSDPVLITGETGTGKELVAASVHYWNEENASKKYIAVNVAEIEEKLLTSELFGHVRGAFTDAIQDRQGLLVEAGDGTLFLDEIGDLKLTDQARLLRVFENRQVRPMGAPYAAVKSFKARLIFATHKYLEDMCWKGAFREDLYQRLREGDTLRVPTLGERQGDLELLVREFSRHWNDEQTARGKETLVLGQGDYDGIVDLCIRHTFRGNVRGLRGMLRSCFKRSLQHQRFNFEHLEAELQIECARKSKDAPDVDASRVPAPEKCAVPFDPYRDRYEDFLLRARRTYFTSVMHAAGNNYELAQKRTGAARKTIWVYTATQGEETTAAEPDDDGDKVEDDPVNTEQ